MERSKKDLLWFCFPGSFLGWRKGQRWTNWPLGQDTDMTIIGDIICEKSSFLSKKEAADLKANIPRDALITDIWGIKCNQHG